MLPAAALNFGHAVSSLVPCQSPFLHSRFSISFFLTSMDAFEQIVAKAFEVQGYWTRIGFKIDLDKKTKKDIGKPSMPRPEIDVLAYKPATNHILLVECKSLLDSPGVRWKAFDQPGCRHADRFKLFHDKALFNAVKKQLLKQLTDEGMIFGKSPTLQLGLVAGKINGKDQPRLCKLFGQREWLFVGPSELATWLSRFADRGYDNDVATIVVKIIERNSAPLRKKRGREKETGT
jgi:hypothetical protein